MLEKSNGLSAGSMVAVRVSRNGKAVIVKDSDNLYQIFSTSTGEVFSGKSPDLAKLSLVDSWRRVTENEKSALVASIAPAPSDIVVEVTEQPKPYRVPANVRDEISRALELSASSFSDDDLQIARTLASNAPVGMPEVEWVHNFFSDFETPQQLRGGYKGQMWASKIVNGISDDATEGYDYDPYAKYNFDGNEDFAYFALGPDEDSPMADKLIAVDFETGAVYSWSMDGFSFSEEIDLPSFDHPMIIPIDQGTAQQLAQWLDQDPYQSYDVRDADPEERNIFEMADPDIDYEELDMVYSIIADASGYTPAERSLNAKRQVRGIGGKFGGKQIPQGSKLQAFKKGKLADQLPIIPNPGQRIQEWLATANAVTAAGSQSTAQPSTDPVPPVQSGTSAQMANPADQPQGDSIYFAIVDASDSTAVLEAIAITKDANGQPQAWVRSHGSWRNSPDTLTKLTGATPPPVVELTAPEPAKTVISQVDASEANIGHFPTTPISASGFVTSDGELFVYTPEDISELVNVFDSLDPSLQPEAKRLARRRARALNRMDILPEDWRTASSIERGEAIASESPLYGDFGQVITAAGHPFDGAKGAERLKQYWIHGKGAIKIRWGTRGDLTRAHRHLAKFVGPDRAWGLAQNYHKSLFGMSNAKHDKLTGQR